MIKRVLSVVVATMMLVSCFVGVVSAADDTRYDGIAYFQNAEDMLNELNADSAASNSAMWDYSDRTAQQTALDDAAGMFAADFTGTGLAAKWDAYCDRLLTRDTDGYVIYYLKMLDMSKEGTNTTVKTAFDAKDAEYDTAGLSLADSFDKLQNYTDAMGAIISANRASLDEYSLSEDKKTEYMLIATKALFQIAFSSEGADMSTAFNTGFLGDDEAKKLLAVIYGAKLTEELAKDNISDVVKTYVNNNFVTVKNDFGTMIKKNAGEDSAAAVFDFMKSIITKSYENASVSDELKSDLKMLFGDANLTDDKGALQIAFETMESSKNASYAMINTWVNLFLREHVQLSVNTAEATTLAANVDADANRITVRNGSAVFGIEGLDSYGVDVNESLLSLGSDYLDIEFYNEDSTPNTFVNYAGGRITVAIDKSKENTYNGYAQLVRTDGTYIETYPVKINNTITIIPGTGSSSGTKVEYTIVFETGGGTEIADEKYGKGEILSLTKIPVKEGYVFEGWYMDKELTIPVDNHEVNGNLTIYAKWVEDNGVAGSGHPTPDTLNGEEHFAYVIGYPDGTVRPENNITRAEVASIFFRLLNDDVRSANITTENSFADVNGEDWYNTAVSTLTKLAIIEGRSTDTFDPNASITRAEFATICARFDSSEYIITDNFTDISEHWAVSYIREAAARGWIKGYEDNTFRPDRLITRAEAMTLINRILNRAPESVADLNDAMVTWEDNAESAWYYLAVQEATNSHSYEMKNNVYEKWLAIEEGTDWTQYQ